LDKISPELLAAYQTTQYRVTGHVPAFTLRIGQYSPELATLYRDSGLATAAFITAWNPRSRLLPNEVNEDRQRQLIVQLEKARVPFYLGDGTSPDGKWREQSLLALGLDLASAKSIAEQFEQNGFIYCDGEAVPQLILLH
jgi:hypothetical protein